MLRPNRARHLLLGLAILLGSLAPRAPAGAAPPEGVVSLPSPQWVGAVDQRGRAQLTWIRNPAFASVRIYRRDVDEMGGFGRVGETQGNTFVDTAAQAGRTYRYRLAGVFADGREGPPSAEFTVRIAVVTRRPPSPPEWEGYLVVGTSVGLRWTPREDEDVIAYNVYRRDPPETEFRLVGSSRGTTYQNEGLEADRVYVYALTAIDSAFRETPLSRELEVRVAQPQEAARPKVPPAWRVRRTRLIALVAGGDVPFERPADVAVGPVTGSVYVADSGLRRVFVFSPAGVYLRSVGVNRAGGTAFRNVLGLAVDRSETLYAVDAGTGVVQAWTLEGRPGRRIDLSRRKGDDETGLIDAAVAPDGRIFVVDNLNNRVAAVDPEGGTRQLGRQGAKGGEFSAPTFCAVDAAGSLHVSDALNGRVQVFSPAGEFRRAFGRAERGPGGLGRPKGIAVSAAGEIYVADSWLNTVQVFDAAGEFLALLGDEAGKPLDLGSPNGVALGPGNTIVVAERLAARLQIREILPDAR